MDGLERRVAAPIRLVAAAYLGLCVVAAGPVAALVALFGLLGQIPLVGPMPLEMRLLVLLPILLLIAYVATAIGLARASRWAPRLGLIVGGATILYFAYQILHANEGSGFGFPLLMNQVAVGDPVFVIVVSAFVAFEVAMALLARRPAPPALASAVASEGEPA